MAREIKAHGQKQTSRWTPYMLKRLRGKRTQTAFGALLGAPKNTIWRWEAGQAHPDARYEARLAELAQCEHFLTDWELVGSMTLLDDLEGPQAAIVTLFQTSLAATSHQLGE